MARRKAQSQEFTTTLIILIAILLVMGTVSLPRVTIFQLTISVSLFIILAILGYYYFFYRKLVAYREGLLQLGIDEVDGMSGIEFEEYIAELFRRQGYGIEMTTTTGDFGVDLVIVKDGVRTSVQTKRYSKSVGQKAIREAVTGMKKYKCTQSMVVTNSYFTRLAIELAVANDCILINRDELIKMIARNKPSGFSK